MLLVGAMTRSRRAWPALAKALVAAAAASLAPTTGCSCSSSSSPSNPGNGDDSGGAVSDGAVPSTDATGTAPGDGAGPSQGDAEAGAPIDGAAILDGAGGSSDAGSDATTAGEGGGAEASASLDSAVCDAAPTSPDLTSGAWLICNATDDVPGRIWTGILTFATETPTCTGATLSGTFHWVSNEGANGMTDCNGTYDAATNSISLNEYSVSGGSGVTTGTDLMTYDPSTDQLVNGSWEPESGMWAVATRVDQDAGPVCGDGR
jgi:hypothetical protein